MTSLWIAKHQSQLPSIFVSFFVLTADANTATLNDNKVKSEISNLRSTLASTNYKTKLVIVILAEDAVAPSDLEERLSNIRRASGLEAKSFYFLPSASSAVEVREFVRNLLSTLQATSIEYYRDLSKHARRKRNRSTVPLPTIAPSNGTSRILSLPGWNVRYEFKLGVFAEFRQEMDAACRNYESAYENLFTPEVLELIHMWSPRFNEARLLSDAIAIRIIRCQLWNGNSTTAVRTWKNHRDKIKDLLDRRGNGTQNYCWEAWQSTWSRTMAEIISKAELTALQRSDVDNPRTAINFAPPEKTLPIGQRVLPWEQLHHEGYWYKTSYEHLKLRRTLALEMPEEDRRPPGQSPASLIASRAQSYDCYLCPEPHEEYPIENIAGYNYSADVQLSLQRACQQFSSHGQLQETQHLQLLQALEHMNEGRWQDALSILKPLWMAPTWRRSGWWPLLQEVGWAAFECASHAGDSEMLVHLEWTLSNSIFHHRVEHRYDLHQILKRPKSASPRPALVIDSDETTSSIIPSLAFAKSASHAGEPLDGQICLRSHLQSSAAPISLTAVKVDFEGSLRPLLILAEVDGNTSDEQPLVQIVDIQLQDTSVTHNQAMKRRSFGSVPCLAGYADLTLRPHEIRVFNLRMTPREAGELRVNSITLLIEDDDFSLAAISHYAEHFHADWWELKNGVPFLRTIGLEGDMSFVDILPKPPRLQISVQGLETPFYANEDIELRILIKNEEEEPATALIRIRFVTPTRHPASLRWVEEEHVNAPLKIAEVAEGDATLIHREIGLLQSSSSAILPISITNTAKAVDHELEVTVEYHLESDQDTQLIKTEKVALSIIRPFEADYELRPRLDERNWPNFFEISRTEDGSTGSGPGQKFALTATLYSFARDEMIIESATLTVSNITGNARIDPSPGALEDHQVIGNENTTQGDRACLIQPNETKKFMFDLMVQKMKFADRQNVEFDLILDVRWRRSKSADTTSSLLEIPRFVLPVAEPRVLLTKRSNPSSVENVSGLCGLAFTIENPSMHFLTFNLLMESSDDFALSGPKAAIVSLVPISRHAVYYNILANKMTSWVRVNLTATDAYFGKTLRVQPASQGVRTDKKGNVLVWID